MRTIVARVVTDMIVTVEDDATDQQIDDIFHYIEDGFSGTVLMTKKADQLVRLKIRDHVITSDVKDET